MLQKQPDRFPGMSVPRNLRPHFNPGLLTDKGVQWNGDTWCFYFLPESTFSFLVLFLCEVGTSSADFVLRVIAVFDGREYIESRLRIVPPVTLDVALIVHHVQYVAFLCPYIREGVIAHPTCIYTCNIYI